MILVDIQVPMLDRVYDFELNEELKAGELLEDILMLIIKEEKYSQGKSAGMVLYAVRQERILDREKTMRCQGVRDGDRLILI
ncbi:MAG: glutamyl-tRNA amidotransferase [Lachnospiraceae bacterium]|nr:glutamyl-tRNA amidotransferase [Lachnospiraceae bacterium]